MTPPTGFYRNQHFTAKAGKTDATMVLKGNLDNLQDAKYYKLTFVPAGQSCTGPNATWTDTSAHAQDAVNASSVAASGATFENVNAGDKAGRYAVCVKSTDGTGTWTTEEVGDLTVTARADIDWTYVLDPDGDGSVEITGSDLKYENDRVMITDCQATCGVSSPAEGVFLEGHAASLGVANTFIAQNARFDAASEEGDQRTLVDLPSELRTYTTVVAHYCRGNNLLEDAVGTASTDTLGYAWDHRCSKKCVDDGRGNLPAECSSYDTEIATDGSAAYEGALCISEAACREVCSLMQGCYGIDVYSGGNLCFLNAKGPADTGCKAQFEHANLGPSTSWTFLAKEGSTTTRQLQAGAGLSTKSILRFKPVTFTTGGTYKVCFCDSSLLPAGQQHCHAESDYDVEVGTLIVSGVSCLLQETDFRRRTCYSMFHGGLACSDGNEYPADETTPAAGVLPTATEALPR